MSVKTRFLIQKPLIWLVTVGLILSNLSPVQTVRAQAVPTETPTLAPEEAPPFTPTVAPTQAVLSTLDLSSAGIGSLYRMRVKLKYPQDSKRLQEMGVIILKSSGGVAVVQVNKKQLLKLANLRFEPTQIDSVEYMLTVQSLSGGGMLSIQNVTSSAAQMMALASVDTDSDGLTDTEESYWCTNPTDDNSDSPNPPSPTNPSDGDEVDAILKGITAYGPPFALWPQFTPHNPSGNCPDGDYDAVPDHAEEFMLGTSNLRESSDKDKFDDGQELFGVTFCPGTSGSCSYGILPRAEDAAWVSANLPAWVKAPGNSPFVAAFPEPEVEVVPSSLKTTQVTVITNTKGTTVGTEKTYGTASTKGTSSSEANSTTWNEWEESYTTTPITTQQITPFGPILPGTMNCDSPYKWATLACKATTTLINVAYDYCSDNGDNFSLAQCKRGVNQRAQSAKNAVSAATNYVTDKLQFVKKQAVDIANKTKDWIDANVPITTCSVGFPPNVSCELLINTRAAREAENACVQDQYLSNGTTDRVLDHGASIYVTNGNSLADQVLTIPMSYPSPQLPTVTEGGGREWGGSHTVTHTQYEEQTISESSTNQTSDNWSTATAVDSSHAADLRFTYNIVNSGTEYAREVTSLTFNIYVGSDPNPAYTYVAVGSTGQIDSIQNLFPGDSHTYTSNPIALTLEEMRAIDEGAPMRVVMEDIAFGQDQAFYQDAFNGSVLVAMEDGFDDADETIDSYLIPVWDPSDTLQGTLKRFFPVTEDADGNLLSVFTPESATSVPQRCEQNADIAPASNSQVFCKHALTGTSWWNLYLSDGLDYNGAFEETLAAPNASLLVRIVSDRDLDGYNDRNEIRLEADPDDPADHPGPNLLAGYTKACTGNDCTLRMVFQNLGNYDAYGVEAVLYSPDGKVNITNNTIGGSGRVAAAGRVVVGPSDTFQYTITDPSYAEPVIVVSYNDPQGNHRFILPSAALVGNLEADLASLSNTMLPDPGVDISSTSASQANFVINSPHATPITGGKLFVEYIDDEGTVLHEDVTTQDFPSGPTVVSAPINLTTYPPDSTILLAFFTDSQGNILDSSARPLASFGADPLPEANLTTGSNWQIGTQSIVNLPDPWDFGSIQPGTTLHANLTLSNTGLGDLRYSLTGLGNGVTVAGIPAGSLSPSASRLFALQVDTAGLPVGPFSKTLTLRTNDPNHASVAIHITGAIASAAGTANAYKINDFRPWDQYVYVPGPHSQNDLVSFTHSLTDDPTRMFPLYLYDESGSTLKGVGEYGVDFSGQSAPFGVFGTGADGDLTVTSGQIVNTDNTRSALASNANSGQLHVAVIGVPDFTAGQEVVIHQTQGIGAGSYEFGTIASVSGNILILSKNLTNTYTVGGNSKAQVIRVMNYDDVTVQSGGTINSSAWDGSTGGLIVFRVKSTLTVDSGGLINATGRGYRGGAAGRFNSSPPISQGVQGESYLGIGIQSRNANGGGGGGGEGDTNTGCPGSGICSGAGGGGAGFGISGSNGTQAGDKPSLPGSGGSTYGVADLSTAMFLGSGGGGGGSDDNNSGVGGTGGAGGGSVIIAARQMNIVGTISANSSAGTSGAGAYRTGGGGGGSGGAIYLQSDIANLGSSIQALGSSGAPGTNNGGVGGTGDMGRIRIEYGASLNGPTNPPASTQQINFFSLTGSSTSNLYLPEAISVGSYKRYQLQYGQRSLNTTGGDQPFSIHLPNRQYSNVTLSVLVERVAGSGSTFNFCLDFGNDGTCDWTANNQGFSGPVRLDSPDLATALNAYITAQNSSQANLTIPIRVNINTPADVFLFDLTSTPGADADLAPANLTIAPQNGNPASNIPEGSLVNLGAVVHNNGTYKAENFTVAFYLGDPTNGGTLIGSTFIESLVAGSDSSVQTVVWNTAGLLGEKSIYVKVDAASTITESSETNNVSSTVAIVKKKPDLVLENLSLPDARAGETVLATVTVKNLGEADVTGAVIRLYNGAVIDGNALNSVSVDVAEGASVTASIPYSLSNAGPHTVSAKADPLNGIAEADENNNETSSSARVGWDHLVIDAGGAGDIAYIPAAGYGFESGTPLSTCGTAIQQSYRQAGSAESLNYHFDNLLPGRAYHLDLTFATCSGTRSLNMFVDNKQIYENFAYQLSGSLPALNVTTTPQTVSIRLDPTDYADGSVTLAIQRAGGLSGPLVNIIDLQEIAYCYRDSGPSEQPWSASNLCGYDPAYVSDGFNGWGNLAGQTVRFSEDGNVRYKFTGLVPAKLYNSRLVFYEGDGVNRVESLFFDGAFAQTFGLSSSVERFSLAVPQASYADGQLNLNIQRTISGDAVVSEVALEENTRLENGRYPAPPAPGSTDTPTLIATATRTPTLTVTATKTVTPGLTSTPTATVTKTYTSTATVTATRTVTPVLTLAPTATTTKTSTLTATATKIPTTISLMSVGSADGWVLESLENSNVGGTFNATTTTFNLGDDATKKQYLGILSFSTGASLPDTAVLTGVVLRVQKQGIVGGGNPLTTFQGFMVDVKNGFFGTNALQASDFQTAASSSYGPFSPALASNWYTINLTGANVYVNKLATNNGLTQIRLRFKLDDNNNTVANYLSLYSGNAPAASRPQLVITYYVP